MRRARLLTLLPLTALFLLPASAAQAQEQLPEDCAVPPFIDLTQFNVIIGTDESEVLRGTSGPDFICGLLGDDVVLGLGGNDLLLSDTTTFFGNLEAEGGNDVVLGGPGDDEILPGPGNDVVHGGAGGDFLALALGDDVGHGGAGDDVIIGGLGIDRVLGQRGADSLAGGPGDDLINGGPGDDFLAGEIPPPPPVHRRRRYGYCGRLRQGGRCRGVARALSGWPDRGLWSRARVQGWRPVQADHGRAWPT